MTSRALWLSLCLAVLGASAPLRESVAAAKVDLEAYLGDVPMVNDEKTFTSELGDFTDHVISVAPSPKRTLVVTDQIDEDSEVTELEVIVHGKKLLVGTTVVFDGTDQITFFVPKPKKSVAFKLKQGKAYPFSRSSKVFLNGVKVAKAKEYGKVTFLGFEEVTTPLGTFADAAHFMRTQNLRIKSHGQRVEFKDVIESWIVAGLGGVRFIQSEEIFENKVLVETIPATEYLFDHGTIDGEPYPAEATAATVPLPWGVEAEASASASASASGAVVISLLAQAGPGIDLINADATVITQEFVGLTAQARGALVGTRTGAGVVYSRPLPDR